MRGSKLPNGTLIVLSSPVAPEDGGYAAGSQFTSYDVKASLRLNAFDTGMVLVDRDGTVWQVVTQNGGQTLVKAGETVHSRYRARD